MLSLHRTSSPRIRTFSKRTSLQASPSQVFSRHARPKTILISGGSGVVGSDLIPYLRTKGHRVIRLVRRPPLPEKDEVFWDPASGHLDLSPLGSVDAVINLSGRNIGHMPWTASNKQAFIQSRVETTALLIKALARMNTKPEVLINASAIGYYGHRADHPVSENEAAGTGFIAAICRQWEHAALPAAGQGIRVVLLRMGVVLTPKGGALKQMLPAFRMGLGGPMGSGAQWISWIGMDDLLGVINAVLHNPALQGPVNAVSPNPVTNRHFAKTLARVLKRPALLYSLCHCRLVLLLFHPVHDALQQRDPEHTSGLKRIDNEPDPAVQTQDHGCLRCLTQQ